MAKKKPAYQKKPQFNMVVTGRKLRNWRAY